VYVLPLRSSVRAGSSSSRGNPIASEWLYLLMGYTTTAVAISWMRMKIILDELSQSKFSTAAAVATSTRKSSMVHQAAETDSRKTTITSTNDQV
jgi:hypothetical protein